jgi:hypothetical protein
MDHDEDVGVVLEREMVAGLLIATVPYVLRMLADDDLGKAARPRNRRVAAVVIDDDD